MVRPFKFCCDTMFLSVVSSTSNPAFSAAFSSSPLAGVSLPSSFAFVTVWPSRNGISGAGVPWSKRMRLDRLGGGGLHRRGSVKAPCGEFQYSYHLVPRHIEPFHNLVNCGPGLQVLENSRNRHAGIFKHPRAATLARYALHGGAL